MSQTAKVSGESKPERRSGAPQKVKKAFRGPRMLEFLPER